MGFNLEPYPKNGINPKMSATATKQTIEPQPARKKTSQTVKVSVLMPKALLRRVEKQAKAERRMLSPAVVMLVERGLDAAN